MKNLFEATTFQEIKTRIENLSEDASPEWGQMTVAQMLHHCNLALKNALGQKKFDLSLSQRLLSFPFQLFFKRIYYNNKPFAKMEAIPKDQKFSIRRNIRENNPFKVTSQKNFQSEKQELLRLVDLFHYEGYVMSKDARHPLWGKFKPKQWAIGQYKHLNHHLTQFGV